MRRRGHHPGVPHRLIRVKHGLLTRGKRHLGPQPLGTLAAAIPHRAGHPLTRLGLPGAPDPWLRRLRRGNVGHGVGVHLKPSQHDVLSAPDGLDRPMVRSGRTAGEEKAQAPLEADPHRATNAAPRTPIHQQALHQSPWVIREAIWLQACDQLASAVLTWMVLLAVVHVTIALRLRRSTPWAPIPDDHGVLLTSPPLVRVFGQQSHGIF
jgi:hypothetical protein